MFVGLLGACAHKPARALLLMGPFSIHRYLVESGTCTTITMCVQHVAETDWWCSDYQETAVKLQKEWNVEDPEQLPFAPHVTNHALVEVLNRGLLYNSAEREENPKVCGPRIRSY